MEGVAINGDDAVLGLSYAMSGGRLAVNVNYDEQTTDRAEKYTALFEATVIDEDRVDAMYFLSHLRESVARPYMDRIAGPCDHPYCSRLAYRRNPCLRPSPALIRRQARLPIT